MAIDGLTTVPSQFRPKETMSLLEAEIRSRGMTVFAHIDHAAGAAEVGLALRPTELLIFGSAKGGTPLMQSTQTAGIDLPLKALGGKMPTATLGCRTTSRAGWRTDMGSTRAPAARPMSWLPVSERL